MAGPVNITNIQALVDPFKGYQFRMMVTSKGPRSSPRMSELLSLRCTATEIPGIGIDHVPVELAGFTLEYSGRARFTHTWSTTLVEGQNAEVTLAIVSWMKATYSWITGKGGNKSDIASTAQVEQYDNPGNLICTTSIYGIFPIGSPALALSMAESRAIAPTIQWSFDYTDNSELVQQGLTRTG